MSGPLRRRGSSSEHLGAESGVLRRCPILGCHDTTGTPRALSDDQYLCRPCTDRITRLLAKTPDLFWGLRAREKTARGNDTGPLSGTKTPGTSLDLHAAQHATTLADTLQDAARTALILAGDPATGCLPTREEWRVANSLDVLTRHGRRLWAHPYYGPEYAELLLRHIRKAWVILGYGHGRQDVRNHACPHCGLLTLTRYSGLDDYVVCRWCRIVWDRAAYADIVHQWATGKQPPGER